MVWADMLKLAKTTSNTLPNDSKSHSKMQNTVIRNSCNFILQKTK